MIDCLPVVVRADRLGHDDDSLMRSGASQHGEIKLQGPSTGVSSGACGSDAWKLFKRVVRRQSVVDCLRARVRRDRGDVSAWGQRKEERKQQETHDVQEHRGGERPTREAEGRYWGVSEKCDRFSQRRLVHSRAQRLHGTPPTRVFPAPSNQELRGPCMRNGAKRHSCSRCRRRDWARSQDGHRGIVFWKHHGAIQPQQRGSVRAVGASWASARISWICNSPLLKRFDGCTRRTNGQSSRFVQVCPRG